MPRAPTMVLAALTIGALAAPATALATNPSTNGQPDQNCEAQRSQPAGFSSAGFANAQTRYAGSGPGSVNHAGSTHAVSQYDVACFQVSQH